VKNTRKSVEPGPGVKLRGVGIQEGTAFPPRRLRASRGRPKEVFQLSWSRRGRSSDLGERVKHAALGCGSVANFGVTPRRVF